MSTQKNEIHEPSALDQNVTEQNKKTEQHGFHFTKGEEIFNAVTHIVGGAFAIIALIILLVFSRDLVSVITSLVFGLSMIILYTMSAIYHFLRPNKAKKVFRVFDHCAIFLLIAGTYTPFCFITLNGTLEGILLFIFVWVLAVLGITFNAINMHDKRVIVFSQIAYILMGWSILLFITPILTLLETWGFVWLLLGGLMYTFGVIFFALGSKIKYFHSIWHFFVLFGSFFHFISVLFFVVLAK